MLAGAGMRGQVLEEQPGLAMDQKHLLDAILQRVEQDDLGKRPAGAEGGPAPLQRAQRDALLDRAIERVHHRRERVGDRLANRGPHDRKQRVGQRAWIAAHRRGQRFLDRRREHPRQLRVVGTEGDGVGQHAADVAHLHRRVEQMRRQRPQFTLFRADDQAAQLVEAIGSGLPRLLERLSHDRPRRRAA
jgi:hypothetical protein